MLDLTGILFSSIMMLIVVVRAVVLDKTQPWFFKPSPVKVPLTAPKPLAARPPWRR